MANEYYAVTLEFSPRSIRLGFAGEATPHTEISWNTPVWNKFQTNKIPQKALPGYLETASHALSPEQQAQLTENVCELHEKVALTYRQDMTNNRFVFWQDDGYLALSRTLKHLLVAKLLISPGRTKLFVVDGGFSAVEKFQFCQALLTPTGIASVCFVPRSPCSAISANVENAVVVDFGWKDCSVVVVGDLRCILVDRFSRFSEEAVRYRLEEDLNSVGDLVVGRSGQKSVLENVLFGCDSLPQAIAQVIRKQAIDLRPVIAKNLVMTGELAHICGLKGRLIQEVQCLLPDVAVLGKETLGPMAGTSLYCSTTLLRHDRNKWKHLEVTREKLNTEAWKELQTAYS